MEKKQALRIALAFVLAGGAILCAYLFATQPYEIVSYTKTVYETKPEGGGLAFLTIVLTVAALIAAFSGDWD